MPPTLPDSHPSPAMTRPMMIISPANMPAACHALPISSILAITTMHIARAAMASAIPLNASATAFHFKEAVKFFSASVMFSNGDTMVSNNFMVFIRVTIHKNLVTASIIIGRLISLVPNRNSTIFSPISLHTSKAAFILSPTPIQKEEKFMRNVSKAV